jgi:hypothetical protein
VSFAVAPQGAGSHGKNHIYYQMGPKPDTSTSSSDKVKPMADRYDRLMRRLQESVLGAPGATEVPLRQAVASRVAAGAAGRSPSATDIPVALRMYVDKVARHAYQVTDDDVDALRRAGYSEDAIFEITTSVALGAALGRLERGLAALKGEV